MDSDCQPVIAIDIGGTKVAAALIDRAGRLLDQASIPTPGGYPQEALQSLLSWLQTFLAGRPVAGAGIALPAVTDKGRVQWVAPTLPGWSELALAEETARAVGVSAWCEFDGYAAAQGEAWCGAARGRSNAAVLIVGTGIGAGFINNGHLVRGGVGVAGSLGWLAFPDARRGCARLGPPVESYASGSGLLRQARRYQQVGCSPFQTTSDVFSAAASGDRAAVRAVDEASAALASMVLAILSIFAPEIVVLSGGVGSRLDVLGRVRDIVANAMHPFSGTKTVLTVSSLSGPSSLYGAAYFAYMNT
jgi:glucokinase